jgi:HK97 family phage portal protein
MGLFDFFSKKKVNTLFPNIPLSAQVAIQQGIVTWQGQNAQQFVKDGYQSNDIVYSIIKLITDKAKLAPFHVYKIVDQTAAKRYKSLMKQPDKIENWNEVKQLHKKAFELYDGDARLNELLKYPNGEDTWADLVEQWCGFKLITGNSFIYAKMIEGGANDGKPFELFALPAQYMAIVANIDVFPPIRVGYQLYYGKMWTFDTKEILHDKYFNPYWTVTGNELYGQSPLMAAARTLTRSNEAKTAAVASFQNGGPAGVLFMNDDRFDPTSGTQQAQALKKSISEKGGASNFNSIAVSGYKVDWKQIGLSPVELNIIESEKWDMKSLCNIYGVPSQLLNDADNKTYNNQREGEKALTLRCAIPLLDSIAEQLNRKLHSDWGYRGTNVYVGYDIQVYQELEANKAEQVAWLDAAWWISPAQKMEIMGIKNPDYIPVEELQKLYVPSSLQTLDQFQPLDIPQEVTPKKP